MLVAGASEEVAAAVAGALTARPDAGSTKGTLQLGQTVLPSHHLQQLVQTS